MEGGTSLERFLGSFWAFGDGFGSSFLVSWAIFVASGTFGAVFGPLGTLILSTESLKSSFFDHSVERIGASDPHFCLCRPRGKTWLEALILSTESSQNDDCSHSVERIGASADSLYRMIEK